MQIKKKSQAQEKKVAKDIGGKTILASGALWFAKGDVRSDRFLIECKTTGNRYYSLSSSTWEKIYYEAVKDGLRIPVMCITLERENKTLALLRVEDFEGLKGTEPPVVTEPFVPEGYLRSLRISNEGVRFKFKNSKGKPFHLITILWEDFLDIVNNEGAVN